MSAPLMVAHCAAAVRMATGDLRVRTRTLPISYPPLNQLIVYAFPFPRNAATAPELIADPSGDFDGDKRALVALMQDAAARPADAAWPHAPDPRATVTPSVGCARVQALRPPLAAVRSLIS